MESSIRRVNEEVFIAAADVVQLDAQAIDFVKRQALNNARGRARICAHKSTSDTLHEMIIAIRADSYIRPHRHPNKVESFHLIEGDVDVIILSDAGDIEDIVRLGKNKNFYYRLNVPHYHTLLIQSPVVVVHEITNGPFEAKSNDFGTFSPEEHTEGVFQYVADLKEKTAAWEA